MFRSLLSQLLLQTEHKRFGAKQNGGLKQASLKCNYSKHEPFALAAPGTFVVLPRLVRGQSFDCSLQSPVSCSYAPPGCYWAAKAWAMKTKVGLFKSCSTMHGLDCGGKFDHARRFEVQGKCESARCNATTELVDHVLQPLLPQHDGLRTPEPHRLSIVLQNRIDVIAHGS